MRRAYLGQSIHSVELREVEMEPASHTMQASALTVLLNVPRGHGLHRGVLSLTNVPGSHGVNVGDGVGGSLGGDVGDCVGPATGEGSGFGVVGWL